VAKNTVPAVTASLTLRRGGHAASAEWTYFIHPVRDGFAASMTAEEQAVGHLDQTWLRQLPAGAHDRGGHGWAQADDADVPIGEAGKPASAADGEVRDTRSPPPRKLPPADRLTHADPQRTTSDVRSVGLSGDR
jgi:hypothetical protein